MDRIKQFMDAAYAKASESKRRCVIELDKYLNIAVVTVKIGPRLETRHYLDGFEIYVHWLEPEDRRDWVARMKVEGFTGKRIATFLNVSPSTIYGDLKALREHGTRLLNPKSAEKLLAPYDIRVPKRRPIRAAMH